MCGPSHRPPTPKEEAGEASSAWLDLAILARILIQIARRSAEKLGIHALYECHAWMTLKVSKTGRF